MYCSFFFLLRIFIDRVCPKKHDSCKMTWRSSLNVVKFWTSSRKPNFRSQGCNARNVKGCILCVHIETSSLWAEFVNKNGRISVRLVSEEIKSIKLIILIIHIIESYGQNIPLIFLCERWIPCQAVTPVLFLKYRPEAVHCSTKDAYTSEITVLTL